MTFDDIIKLLKDNGYTGWTKSRYMTALLKLSPGIYPCRNVTYFSAHWYKNGRSISIRQTSDSRTVYIATTKRSLIEVMHAENSSLEDLFNTIKQCIVINDMLSNFLINGDGHFSYNISNSNSSYMISNFIGRQEVAIINSGTVAYLAYQIDRGHYGGAYARTETSSLYMLIDSVMRSEPHLLKGLAYNPSHHNIEMFIPLHLTQPFVSKILKMS